MVEPSATNPLQRPVPSPDDSSTSPDGSSPDASPSPNSSPPLPSYSPASPSSSSDALPCVLFVCVHNAGRSQMAAAYVEHLGRGLVEVHSAGSMPAEQINQVAVQAMAEEGIDLSAAHPKILTVDAVRDSDVVVTMGCGDSCPLFPGKRYEDWELSDPAGQGIEAVRVIRDEIRARAQALLEELLPSQEGLHHNER